VTHTDIFPKLMSFQHPLCQKFTCLSLKKVKILQHEILRALKNPYFSVQKKTHKTTIGDSNFEIEVGTSQVPNSSIPI